MTDDGQPIDPPGDLLAAADGATARWLRTALERAARRGGVAPGELDPAAMADVVARTSATILSDLAALLAQDVDDQRTNPLSIYRSHLAEPTELLRAHSVATPSGDRFAADRFPDDPYQLGPATWSDIGDDLHGPGLVWGAWKAKLVLDRRRDEGKR